MATRPPTRRARALMAFLLAAPLVAQEAPTWPNGLSHDPGSFPIAVWLQAPENAPRYAELGINLYVGLWEGPTQEQLDALAEAGMRVFCSQNEVGLQNLDNPAIAGWMHGDEPDNAQPKPGGGYGPPIEPAEIVADYQRIRAADPTRPVLLNLGQGVAWDGWIGRGVRTGHPEDYRDYVKGCDIASFDIYPVTHSKPAVAGKLEFVGRGVRRLRGWSDGRPVWACIETTRIHSPGARPTPEQVRAEVWMAIACGARGIVYFAHEFAPRFAETGLLRYPEIAEAVGRVNRQVLELAPVLNAPAAQVELEDPDAAVAVLGRRHEGVSYLFAVGMSPAVTEVGFVIGGGVRVEVLGEARELEVAEGRFTDSFDGYAVHIYRIEEPLPGKVCRDVLVREVEAGLTAGARRRAGLRDADNLLGWQQTTRGWLRGAFAPLPPADRAPPAVVTVRTLPCDGFRVEHLLIESRAGMHVPAHLYQPDAAHAGAPVPGVLVACGHSAGGKAEPLYQRGAATLARSGLAALVYDPLDQGERAQARRDDGRPLRWGTRAHNLSGAQALLLGWSQAGLEAWDGVRCLDALAARGEVDADRLGICGNSGGGTQSAQLFALDDRLKAAAPSCYLTSLVDLVRSIGPQDAEQNILGQVARGFDHADYLAVRAPAPALICAATRDFFPIDGTRRALEAAGQVYALIDSPEAIALAEVDATHGWHPELIEATATWMARWLEGRTIEPECVAEAPMADAQAARVTPTGCVLDLDRERSVFALLAERAAELEAVRAELSAGRQVARARELCEVRALVDLPSVNVAAVGPQREVCTGRVQVGDGMVLAAATFPVGSRSSVPTTLIVGAGAWSLPTDVVHPADRNLFWLDPHGIADSAPREKAWYGSSGPAGRDAAFGLLLGRPLLGRQAEQILAVARELGAGGRAVDLVARGPAALAALHAAAFEPDLFAAVDVETPIAGWGQLIGEAPDEQLLAFVVPGALAAYDLVDLRQAALASDR